MPRQKKTSLGDAPPATSIEGQENRMIALAMNLAEQRLRDGTASNQLITHFVKQGSVKEKIEQEILEKQKVLIEAKTEALQSSARMEELYANAIEAMKSYSGNEDQNESEELQ